MLTPEEILEIPCVVEAFRRGIISLSENRIKYSLSHEKTYVWSDPEEWVRCHSIAWLCIERSYPPIRLRTEVIVPRRVPSDHADIVVYKDDDCRSPYLVVENKAQGLSQPSKAQAVEQLFGNCNSLRAELGLFDDFLESRLFDIQNFLPNERVRNFKGSRDAVPAQYGLIPQFTYTTGGSTDIAAVSAGPLEGKIRRVHSIIWSGGKRDPLTAFDEWSKLLFAKVFDERNTPTGRHRQFQFGTNETSTAVASRIHRLFELACRQDRTIFPELTRLNLPDTKIADVVQVLQEVSFTRTDIDSIGRAFEEFFGSVFRGGLGQYFTMRQLARFTVAMLEITVDDYVLDPTVGSGGFLLEVLLQTWHRIDRDFSGQSTALTERVRYDFAFQHVFGIEIHEILARICKINLLLHHDGHTNIEGNRSCLDSSFSNPRMGTNGRFSVVVGNPPFGDEVKAGDYDKLGSNQFSSFSLMAGRAKIESEQIILERAIEFLEPGGRLGLILPDGILNNQGENSNAPSTRRFLASSGRILAIVSLPDFAFRKSGAQNKTSILFFRKFSEHEKRRFDRAYDAQISSGLNRSDAVREATIPPR